MKTPLRCGNCKKSVTEAPLVRVNEPGIAGIFWCEQCIRINEPELWNNIQEDKAKPAGGRPEYIPDFYCEKYSRGSRGAYCMFQCQDCVRIVIDTRRKNGNLKSLN